MAETNTTNQGSPVDRGTVVDALRMAMAGGMSGGDSQKGGPRSGAAVDPALVPAVRASAARLGIDPADLLTAMSYETGGTLNPNLWGGKNKQYLGLIQFGPPEQKQYGVKPGMQIADQVMAAENFLRDRGVRPGMGLLDIYSAINAGHVGLYNRSDAANGGAPGTVADKVNFQMQGHQARAQRMLAAQPDVARPPADIPNVQQPAPLPQPGAEVAAPGAPMDLASFRSVQPAAAPQTMGAMQPPERAPFSLAPLSPDALASLSQPDQSSDFGQADMANAMLAQQASTEGQALPLPPIATGDPVGLARARIMNSAGNPRVQLAQRLLAAMGVPGQG